MWHRKVMNRSGRLAIGSILASAAASIATVVGAALLAAWLAFYGGLERLGLEPDDFVRVFVAAVGLAAVPVAAALLLDVAWLAETRMTVAIALVIQCLTLWFGLTTNARGRGSRR